MPDQSGNAFNPPSEHFTPQILRSLEELRHTLALRVERLSHAIARLRALTADLERTLATTEEREVRLSESPQVPPPSSRIAPPSTMPDAASSVSSPRAGPPRQTSSHPAPSAIASELSALHRPIALEDIHLLLDRASASAIGPDGAADPPEPSFEETLTRLRRTRERLRALQDRNLPDAAIAPNMRRSREVAQSTLHDARHPILPAHRAVPIAGGAGLAIVSDTTFPRTNGVVVNQTTVLESAQPTGQRAFPGPRRLGRLATHPERSRSSSRGCPPTNTRSIRHQPAPIVVRSIPASPASSDTTIPYVPLPTSDRSRPANSVNPVSAAASTAETPSTPDANRRPRRPDTVSRPRWRPDPNSGLTFRGMDVEARIADPNAPHTAQVGAVESLIDAILINNPSFQAPAPPAQDASRSQPVGGVAGNIAGRNNQYPTLLSQFARADAPILALSEGEQVDTDRRRLLEYHRMLVEANHHLRSSDRRAADSHERLVESERRLAAAEASLAEAQRQLQRIHIRRGREDVLGVDSILRALGEADPEQNINNSVDRGVANGPRNERPEEVDSLVRIRQLQDQQTDRQASRGRLRERMQELAAIRAAVDEVSQERQRAASSAPTRESTVRPSERSRMRALERAEETAEDIGWGPPRIADSNDLAGIDTTAGNELVTWARAARPLETVVDVIRREVRQDGVTPSSPVTLASRMAIGRRETARQVEDAWTDGWTTDGVDDESDGDNGIGRGVVIAPENVDDDEDDDEDDDSAADRYEGPREPIVSMIMTQSDSGTWTTTLNAGMGPIGGERDSARIDAQRGGGGMEAMERLARAIVESAEGVSEATPGSARAVGSTADPGAGTASGAVASQGSIAAAVGVEASGNDSGTASSPTDGEAQANEEEEEAAEERRQMRNLLSSLREGTSVVGAGQNTEPVRLNPAREEGRRTALEAFGEAANGSKDEDKLDAKGRKDRSTWAPTGEPRGEVTLPTVPTPRTRRPRVYISMLDL